MRMLKIAAGHWVVGLWLAATSSGAALADDGPKRLACALTDGTISSYEKGRFALSKAEMLAFDLIDIDLEGQTANLIASAGAAPGAVRIVRAINANHFIEVANEGFLNLTTVYDKDPATGKHPVVHSRHFGLLGQPIYAQYTGHCMAR